MQNTQRDANIGRTLRDRFRLDEAIGAGSMGTVYRAWDQELQQSCAVKLLHLGAARREAVVVRFCDEARIIAQLYHPNIVELIDFGSEPEGSLFLAMELLRGQDLHTLMQAEGKLPLARTLELARQVGSALHCMHQAGIVHRDIKPRNIILTGAAGDLQPRCAKVIDFGLSKISDGENRGSDGLLIGTPEYLPPEAWSGTSSDVDARADQWALAVVVYRLLSGRLPFDVNSDTILLAHEIKTRPHRPLRELVPELPAHIDAALARALSKDKAQRFGSVPEFVRALCRSPLPSTLCGRPGRPRALDEDDDRATRLQRPRPEPPPSTQLALPLPALPADELTTLSSPGAAVAEETTRLPLPPLRPAAEPVTALRPLPSPLSRWRSGSVRAARWLGALAAACLLGRYSHRVLEERPASVVLQPAVMPSARAAPAPQPAAEPRVPEVPSAAPDLRPDPAVLAARPLPTRPRHIKTRKLLRGMPPGTALH